MMTRIYLPRSYALGVYIMIYLFLMTWTTYVIKFPDSLLSPVLFRPTVAKGEMEKSIDILKIFRQSFCSFVMIWILTSWIILSALLIGINLPLFSRYIKIGEAPKKCTHCRCREARAAPSNFDLQRDFNEFMERIMNEGVSDHDETSDDRIKIQEVSNQYDSSDDKSFKVSIESDTEDPDYNERDEYKNEVSNKIKITASRSKCPSSNNYEGTENSDFINFMKSMKTLSFEDKETMRIKYMNLQKNLQEPCVLDNSEYSTSGTPACVDESDSNELKSAIRNNKSDFLVKQKIPGSLCAVSLPNLYQNANNSCTTSFAGGQITKIGNVLVSQPRQFTVQQNFDTDNESELNEVDDVVSKQNL